MTDEARPVIDVHTHVVTRHLAEVGESGGRRHGIDFGRDERGHITSSTGGPAMPLPWPTPLQTAEERIASMDDLGVDVHVLSLTPTMHWYGLSAADGTSLAVESNDDLAEMVAGHPDRFRGLAFLPLQDPAASVRELERCVRTLGFAGALVGTHVNGRDWDAPDLFPVLEAARDLGALLFFHPTRGRANPFLGDYHLRNLVGNPMETAIAFSHLVFGGVLDRLLPAAKLCFAHGGGYGCFGVDRLDHGAKARPECGEMERLPSDYLRSVHVDSLVHGHRTLDVVVDRVGANRIVLGSDYPADMGESDPVGFVRTHPGLSDEQRRMILSDNAARLLA